MNEERTSKSFRQMEHIRDHLWHIYSIPVNQVMFSCYFEKVPINDAIHISYHWTSYIMCCLADKIGKQILFTYHHDSCLHILHMIYVSCYFEKVPINDAFSDWYIICSLQTAINTINFTLFSKCLDFNVALNLKIT